MKQTKNIAHVNVTDDNSRIRLSENNYPDKFTVNKNLKIRN